MGNFYSMTIFSFSSNFPKGFYQYELILI